VVSSVLPVDSQVTSSSHRNLCQWDVDAMLATASRLRPTGINFTEDSVLRGKITCDTLGSSNTITVVLHISC